MTKLSEELTPAPVQGLPDDCPAEERASCTGVSRGGLSPPTPPPLLTGWRVRESARLAGMVRAGSTGRAGMVGAGWRDEKQGGSLDRGWKGGGCGVKVQGAGTGYRVWSKSVRRKGVVRLPCARCRAQSFKPRCRVGWGIQCPRGRYTSGLNSQAHTYTYITARTQLCHHLYYSQNPALDRYPIPPSPEA